jgi:serpin B
VPEARAEPATDLAGATRAFGLALYDRLAVEGGDVFVSPLGISGAFGPVAAGARGETQDAIRAAMRFPAGDSLHAQFGALMERLGRDREGATLRIGNALWVQQGFPLEAGFSGIVQNDYRARIETLDFAVPAPAADRINAWVSEATAQRIRTLVSPDMLGADTRLVVTNAVYFLGDWAAPFNASQTREQPFHLEGGGTKPMPLMYRKGRYRHLDGGSFQAIDLPYEDETLAMSVFLPREKDGLAAFERELGAARLADWLQRLDAAEMQETQLWLPRFQLEYQVALKPALAALGMGIAFDRQRADFRGISDAELFISDAVHKSFLRVDEKGTEAAAATGVVISTTSMPVTPPVQFRADHPFFLVIRDKPSGAILFVGRVTEPTAPSAG